MLRLSIAVTPAFGHCMANPSPWFPAPSFFAGRSGCTQSDRGEKGTADDDTSLDELGPVDYVVVEFPAGASNFTGEMATSC